MSGLGLRIRHPASCPEENPVWCAENGDAAPEYVHDQGILWFRLDAGMSVGLGEGWQIAASAPFDVRFLTIDYETPSGAPFEPPVELRIHHRDETLLGPSDGRLWVRKYALVNQSLTLGGGVGGTVPLGHTEPDPYALTEQGHEHQHFQLGSGTVDPVVSGLAMWTGARWGGLLAMDARIPLYENRHDYRPPLQGSFGGGPSYRPHPKVQVAAGVDGLYEAAEHWSGRAYGGRVAAVGQAGALWAPMPSLALQLQARTTLAQRMFGAEGDEAVRQRLVVTVGVTLTGKGHDPATGESTE